MTEVEVRGMARKGICPPGVVCLSNTLGIVLTIAIAIALYFVYLAVTTNGSVPSFLQTSAQQQKPIQIVNQMPPMMGGGDDRYTRAPEPLRFWQTAPDLRGAMIPPGAVPINVSTRGLPQSYQQMGLIKSGDQLLPLYGRQTAYRSDRYNYYTRTDTYNPIQVPIRYEKRDCMDSIGCEELLGGENIKIAGLGKEGHVEVYKFDGPTYIPGLV
jgi:hypothetical protein